MVVDITDKHLSEQYPVYTKAGEVWKNRINWDMVLQPGALISTHFGIFTFVASYKEGKDWYIKLSDGNNTYIMKRQQARKNKKLPKASKIQQVIYLARIDLIESLLDQAENFITEYNKTHKDYVPWGQVGITRTSLNRFTSKIRAILSIGYIDEPLFNKFKRQLINYYHPDNGNVQDVKALTIVTETISLVKRVRGIL